MAKQKMYLAEGRGSLEKLIQTCLQIFENGKKIELYEVLPYIGVVRARSFLQPLLKLLESDQQDQKEFAAVALGSLGDPAAIEPLYKVFMRKSVLRGSGAQSLQATIVSALGEIGDERAIDLLLKIYDLDARPSELASRRRKWVLSAIGNLAQQGSMLGVKELTRLMKIKDSSLRALAVTELAIAYWHRPNELPETVLQEMMSLTKDTAEEVRKAAFSSLSDLANLGCCAAEQSLDRTD